MLVIRVLLLSALYESARSIESEDPVLYYYGLEENERSLPACSERQACSALVQRYWRPPALVRLCRCRDRRQHCDERADPPRLIELNNRAHMQFCQPTTNWPMCSIDEKPLTVVTSHDQMNPDVLEIKHHENIELTPPKIIVKCKCRYPNYWKWNSTVNGVQMYKCASMPVCSTGEFCGNVSYDLNALYQSCLCPKHHICVHNGGVTHIQVSELLYHGRGWRAYCQRIETDSDYSYDDY